MAIGRTLKTTLKKIVSALKDFAGQQCWKPDEYKILFQISKKWGFVSVFFIVKDFGELDSHEMWERVWKSLENSTLTEQDRVYTIRLSVRDWKQMREGGIYSIPLGFIDQEELLAVPSVVD